MFCDVFSTMGFKCTTNTTVFFIFLLPGLKANQRNIRLQKKFCQLQISHSVQQTKPIIKFRKEDMSGRHNSKSAQTLCQTYICFCICRCFILCQACAYDMDYIYLKNAIIHDLLAGRNIVDSCFSELKKHCAHMKFFPQTFCQFRT